MPISFDAIPSNIRVPGAYFEISNSRALRGLPQFKQRIVVIGQRLSTGSVSQGVLTMVPSAQHAATYFGRGSMLAHMFEILKQNNRYTETWAIALNDNGSGVAATGSLSFAGSSPTQAGTLNLYIGGRLVQIAVQTTDTANGIATNVAAAINNDGELPVTASASTSTVTVTARHKGECGNDIDLRFNYYGEAGGERYPAGVVVAITAMSGGTTNPDIATALNVLPDEIYDYFIVPYTDTSNVGKLETELNDRWGPLQMLEGLAFAARQGTVSNLSTYGAARNNPNMTILGYNGSPSPSYLWASAYGAQAAYYLAIDPARPLQTLPLIGILPPAEASRFTQSERNTLLYDGIATFTVSRAGQVQIERAISTYQTNASGAQDPSYLDIESRATLTYLRQSARHRVMTKYERHKLMNDGVRYDSGQHIVTPGKVRMELIALYSEWQAAGLVENIEQFKQELIVERNASDPNRLDALLPPDLANQLRVFAGQVAFLL